MERPTRARRVVLFVAAAAAAAALIGGIISSRATAASPTPAASAPAGAGKVVKVGDRARPTTEPVHRLERHRLRDLHARVPALSGARLQDAEARRQGRRQELGGLPRRPHLDLPPQPGHHLARRRAGDRRGRRLHLQLHHRQRHVAANTASKRRREGRRRRPLHGKGHLHETQGEPDAGVARRRARAHLVEALAAVSRQAKFQNPPPIIGDGPWQVVSWKKNDFVRLVAKKDLLPGAAQDRWCPLRHLPERRLDGRGPQGRQHRRAYLVPAAQYERLKNTPGITTIKYTFFNWDYLGFNCYTGKSHGNPVLRDQRFRAALEYAINRQQIVERRLLRLREAGLHVHAARASGRTPTTAGSRPTGCAATSTPPRPTSCSMRPATRWDRTVSASTQGKDIVLRLWALPTHLRRASAPPS